jgi:twitching motility protein PilJ
MKFSLKLLGTTNTWLFIFSGILLLSFVLMIATFSLVAIYNQHDEEYLGGITQLRLLTQQMTQHASQAARGNAEGFEKLASAREEYKLILNRLTNGNQETGMPGAPPSAIAALTALTNLWSNAETNLDASLQNLLDTQEAVTRLYGEFTELKDVTVDLVTQTEEMINAMISGGATQTQMSIASRQLMWLERMSHSIRMSFINDSEEAMSAEGQLDESISQFQ